VHVSRNWLGDLDFTEDKVRQPTFKPGGQFVKWQERQAKPATINWLQSVFMPNSWIAANNMF